MSRTIYSILCLLYIWAPSNTVVAQAIPSAEGNFKPLVIWIYPTDLHEAVSSQLAALKAPNAQKYNWLLLRDTFASDSKIQITRQINDYLNEETAMDKQRIYILEWSQASPKPYFENKDEDIISDTYLFNVGLGLEKFDLAAVLRKFDQHYIWAITLLRVKEQSLVNTPQLRRFSYGLTFGNFNAPFITPDSLHVPTSVRKMGFSIGYRIRPRLYLYGRGLFSMSIPDQSNVQATLFDQIDMSAGGKQTVSIEMKAHIFMQGTVQANYLLTPNRRLQPFVGVGLSHFVLRSAKIAEEVEIDVDDIFSGGGAPSGLSGGLGDGDLPFTVVSTSDPFITAGLSIRLLRNVYWMTAGEYHFNGQDEISGIKLESKYPSYSLNTGIQFEFQKRQKEYFQYLN